MLNCISMGRGKGRGAITLTRGQYRPDGPRKLVGGCRHGNAVRASRQLACHPLLSFSFGNDCPRPTHQQGSQVRIASLGDAQLANPTSGASLSRHQAKPGC